MKLLQPDKAAYKLFHQATLALSEIESNGIRVDTKYLKKVMEEVAEQVKSLERELRADEVFRIWRKRFGEKANLGGHDQLGKVFFDELGYKRAYVVKKRTKKSDIANSEAAFADVDHPFVKKWFQWLRLRDKVLATYFKGIERETVDGFCHPMFNLNTVISYRSSSERFNFQNIPKRMPDIAKLIRSCFVSRRGFQLGEIDYSQAEVRGAAVYTDDRKLIKYVKNPDSDMHRDTAKDLFFITDEGLITKPIRHMAKNMFVFPEFYGAAWFQQAPMMWAEMHRQGLKLEGTDLLLWKHLKKNGIKELGDCDPKSHPKPGTFARHVMEVERIMWKERFKEYDAWKKKWWEDYKKNGGFKFKTGFVCNGVFTRNEVLSFAIQGTAFHWMLWSLVQIHQWLVKNRMQTCIVGQIHDSIVADIHPSEKDDFVEKCHDVMTQDIVEHWPWISVPLEVEAELSPINGSWIEKEEK